MVAVIVRMRGDVLFMFEKYPNNCLPKKSQVALIGARGVWCNAPNRQWWVTGHPVWCLPMKRQVALIGAEGIWCNAPTRQWWVTGHPFDIRRRNIWLLYGARGVWCNAPMNKQGACVCKHLAKWIEATQQSSPDSQKRELLFLRRKSFSNQLCSKAPSKAVNAISSIFGRQHSQISYAESRKRNLLYLRQTYPHNINASTKIRQAVPAK